MKIGTLNANPFVSDEEQFPDSTGLPDVDGMMLAVFNNLRRYGEIVYRDDGIYGDGFTSSFIILYNGEEYRATLHDGNVRRITKL